MNRLRIIARSATKLPLIRLGTVVIITALLAVLAYFTRDAWMLFLQWSVAPFGIWAFLAILSVAFSRPLSFGSWRKIAGGLLAAFALSGVLTFIPFPPTLEQTSWGGQLGYYIAFSPFQRESMEMYVAALLLVEARVLIVMAAAGWVGYSPNLLPTFLTNILRPLNLLAFWKLFERAPRPQLPAKPEPLAKIGKKGKSQPRSVPGGVWKLPTLPAFKGALFQGASNEETASTSRLIEETLANHGIEAKIDSVFNGPAVTLYGITPGWRKAASGRQSRVKVGDIIARENDLGLALKSSNIRFEKVLQGESQIGLEIPNKKRGSVTLMGLFSSKKWEEFESQAALPVALGVKSGGEPVFCDLAEMTHTMVAGTTGSGKSVCINGLITSLLAFRTPNQLRMVLIDPKRVEMSSYRNIPHLLTPVIVDTEPAVAALNALVKEMEERLKTLEDSESRKISSYNQSAAKPMPYILVVIDEMADLMLRAGEKVERQLVRLAQLGRAPGIHLLIATQRPSVDVITGLIKANFPSRISFAVRSNTDSRTVLDEGGAEKLLGNGDMLYFPNNLPNPERVQGAFVEDNEIANITAFWRKAGGKTKLPQLDISSEQETTVDEAPGGFMENADSLLMEAAEITRRHKTMSISYLQRQLGIGFPRAGKIMDQLEKQGVVGPATQNGPRKVMEDREK